jgi:hypothetical protein
MTSRSTHAAIAVAIATALGSVSASAADTAGNQAAAWNFPHVMISQAAAPAVESPAAAAAGMRAFKDKETGKLRHPSAQEMAEMAADDAAAAPAAAPAAMSVRTLSNGMITATLDESFMSYSVATKSSTGHVHADCAADAHEANAAIQAVPAQEVSNDR